MECTSGPALGVHSKESFWHWCVVQHPRHDFHVQNNWQLEALEVHCRVAVTAVVVCSGAVVPESDAMAPECSIVEHEWRPVAMLLAASHVLQW